MRIVNYNFYHKSSNISTVHSLNCYACNKVCFKCIDTEHVLDVR